MFAASRFTETCWRSGLLADVTPLQKLMEKFRRSITLDEKADELLVQALSPLSAHEQSYFASSWVRLSVSAGGPHRIDEVETADDEHHITYRLTFKLHPGLHSDEVAALRRLRKLRQSIRLRAHVRAGFEIERAERAAAAPLKGPVGPLRIGASPAPKPGADEPNQDVIELMRFR
jgi:hypothetical protein